MQPLLLKLSVAVLEQNLEYERRGHQEVHQQASRPTGTKLLEAIGPVPAAVQKLIETLAREAWQIAVAPVHKVGDEELAVTADDWHHLSIEVMHQPLHALKQLPPLAMPWQPFERLGVAIANDDPKLVLV